MSPCERKAMINRERTNPGLIRQCRLLQVNRSSRYYTRVGMDGDTLKLMHEIDRVSTKYPFFVRHQIATYQPRNRFHAGRHRARRLMGIPW